MKSTSLLDEFRLRKKKDSALLKEETIKSVREALTQLSQRINFKNAYLFGSILKPYFSDDSDIDIAFEGLRDEDFFKALGFLSDYLNRDVDIIQIEEHKLKDKIIKEGLLIYRM